MLDDRSGYAQSVVADFQPLAWGYVGVGMGALGSSPIGFLCISAPIWPNVDIFRNVLLEYYTTIPKSYLK